MKKNWKVVSFISFMWLVFYANMFGASSEQYLSDIMSYIKWGAGVLGTILGASAVIFGGIGMFKKMSGDQAGDQMLKNALIGAIFAALAWAAFGMIIMAGAEHGTAIQGVEKGFQ